jgi:uncharacterized protein YlxW (UPF0749 family)
VRRPSGRLSVALVACVLGVLLVIQFRAQNTAGGLSSLSTQDLTTLIASLNDRNNQLRAQVSQLQDQLSQLNEQQRTGQSNVGDLQNELSDLRIWAGLDAAVGPGVNLTIGGPISPDGLNAILNELRLAGAEAISVEGTRVVSSTVVAGRSGQLTVEGRSLSSPIQVVAIGAPANLQAILVRPGGVIGRIQVSQPDVSVAVDQSGAPLTVPATTHDLIPADGRAYF